MDHPPSQQGRQTRNQFQLLAQRRFAPYFIVTLLGAFNDNVFRQAIIGLLGVMVLAGAMDSSIRGIYTQLAPAVFILPYFLFPARGHSALLIAPRR